jgi:hypothetical protein
MFFSPANGLRFFSCGPDGKIRVKGSGTLVNSTAGSTQSSFTQYIAPKGVYETFADESHYLEKLKEWGLSAKKEFWYKDRYQHCLVTIKGFEVFGETAEYNTLVIEFQNGKLSCIHPAYLKEMQSSNFGKEIIVQNLESTGVEAVPEVSTIAPQAANTAKPPKTAKAKKPTPPKLVLPEEKVHFSGKVRQFALSWNHFNEDHDEVIVFEDVVIEQDEPIKIGLAWGSHSKTLKKFELSPGDILEFDGKVVKKSLPKGKDVDDENMIIDVPVPYKINNPSKIVKK